MNIFQHGQHIRDVLFYTKKYFGTTLVFFIDMALCNSQKISVLVKDIVQVLNAGIQVVVVPGLEVFSGERKKDNNKNIQIINEKEIVQIQTATFKLANTLITEFATHRQTAVIGNWIRARSCGVINEIDYQHSGIVEKIDDEAINKLLEDKVVPIVPAVGWSYMGKPYYINPQDIAVCLSLILKAKKLFFLLKKEIQIIKQEKTKSKSVGQRMSLVDAKMFLTQQPQEKTKQNSILYKAVQALSPVLNVSDLTRIHILSGSNNTAFLNEIFSNKGVGFMVYSDEYDAITALQQEDTTSVLEIMNPHVKKGILLHRNAEDILKKQKDFFVYKTDQSIHGVAALHSIGGNYAEIAALAVTDIDTDIDDDLGINNKTQNKKDNNSIGKRLIQYLLHKAKQQNYTKVFVFTVRTGDWFERLGFVQINPKQELPKKRLDRYLKMARNSRVYCINIDKT